MALNFKEVLKRAKQKVASELRENFGVGEAGFGDLGRNLGNVARKYEQPITNLQNKVAFPVTAGVASLTRPIVKALSPQAEATLGQNIQEAKQINPTAYTIGQQAPLLVLPSVKIPAAIEAATPAARLVASGAIRGLETAGINTYGRYADTGNVQQATQGIPRDIALGAAFNTVLSPKLVGAAGKQLLNREASGTTRAITQELPKTAGAVKSESITPQPARPSQSIQTAEREISSSATTVPGNTPLEKKVNLLDQYLRTPDRVLKKIGLEKEMAGLRKSYDAYKAELPQEINRLQQWKNQVSPEGNVKIFKFLDGQIGAENLAPNEQQVAGEIQDYLKGWADRLGLPQDKRITNYITHIFDQDLIKKEFPDEIANIISDKVAGSVYDPFTQQRLGKLGYVEDTFRALEAYVKRATRKVNLDPALESIKGKADTLEQSQFKYVKNYIDRVNLRPTDIDNIIDNSIKQAVGYRFGQRPVANLSRTARQIGYRGGLGLNVGTALKNLSQGANTYAKLGEKYTAVGYANAIKNLASGSDELERVGVLSDDLIQDKTLSVGKQLLQKVDKGLFAMFETAEKINRGAAYFGAKAQALQKGLPENEAIDYAKKIVRDTQFSFGSIDTPPILQSDIAKLLGQFQSYTIKQGEFLGELAAAKDIAGLVRWSAASLLFVHTVGKALGMTDKDLIPTFRIGAPPALKFPTDLAKLAMGGTDEYGNPLKLGKVLKKDLPVLVPGGTQFKKTYEGLTAANQGYSQTDTGRVRYPIEPNTLNKIKGGLFGQYNFPEARQYFDQKQSPLSDQQSEIFKSGAGKGYYDQVMSNRAASKAEAAALDALKSGKQPKTGQQVAQGVYRLPSGKYAYLDGEDTKTYDPTKYDKTYKAFKKLASDETLPDAIKQEVLQGTDPRLAKRLVFEEAADQFDADFALAKDRAKRNDDVQSWLKAANVQYQFLNDYLGTLDPKEDKLEYTRTVNKIEDLASEGGKYQAYKGFKKPKVRKAKKLKKLANVSASGALPKFATPSVKRVKAPRARSRGKRAVVKQPKINTANLASGR